MCVEILDCPNCVGRSGDTTLRGWTFDKREQLFKQLSPVASIQALPIENLSMGRFVSLIHGLTFHVIVSKSIVFSVGYSIYTSN